MRAYTLLHCESQYDDMDVLHLQHSSDMDAHEDFLSFFLFSSLSPPLLGGSCFLASVQMDNRPTVGVRMDRYQPLYRV